ncbi:MAG: site-specific DNA-methyltransferase [Saprospiraceae bacterium]|nr:site-specific DNA-methyltransferase [Candidatus Vicinibacter affinis]
MNTDTAPINYTTGYAQVFSRLFFGDCLIESDKIQNGSVDLILTDLPYGNMKGIDNPQRPKSWGNKEYLKWDECIEPKSIYEVANRILRKNGKMILFSQQPHTTELITKQVPNLPHSFNMIWEKNDFANALLCNKAPVSYYEDILIFSKNHDFEGMHPLRPYFKIVMDFIGLNLKQINTKLEHRRAEHTFYIDSTQYGLCTEKTYNELIKVFGIDKMEGFKTYSELKPIDEQFKKEFASTFNLWEGNKYKSNILKYKKDYNGYHPTQKPVLLLEDLIKTFSNEGNLVVDLTMGSGSTGVACKNTNRNFIGIEKDENYFKIAEQRINARTLFS